MNAVAGAGEFAPIDSDSGIETDRLIDNVKRDANIDDIFGSTP
jgi:hypothetical protein